VLRGIYFSSLFTVRMVVEASSLMLPPGVEGLGWRHAPGYTAGCWCQQRHDRRPKCPDAALGFLASGVKHAMGTVSFLMPGGEWAGLSLHHQRSFGQCFSCHWFTACMWPVGVLLMG